MKTSVLTAATRGVDLFRRPQEQARRLTCCPLQRVAFSLPSSSLIGEALHDSVLNFLERHVRDCEPDALEALAAGGEGHIARLSLPSSCSITPSRACRSAAVLAVCGSYFNVPRIQRAMVATSASRGQRTMANLSGTSTTQRF